MARNGYIVKLMIVGLSVTGILAGSLGFAAPAAKNRPLAVVKIPDTYDPTSIWAPYVADELGFFAEEGIKAQFTGIIPPGQHISAVVAGSNDVGGMHVNRTINGIDAGAKIKAVVAQSETTKERPHMSFVALDSGAIKTPRDLVNKRFGLVALGGCNEYTPYEYLRKHGIDQPKGKIKLIVVPPANLEQALRKGDIDVAGFHGDPIEVLSHGGLRVVFTDYEVWGKVGGATPLYFSEKFIKEKPEVVRGFVRAMARTNNWINTNHAKADAIQAKRTKIDVKRMASPEFAKDGVIKDNSVQVWIELLNSYGEIKKDYRPADIATNEFNDLAKKIEKKKTNSKPSASHLSRRH